MLKCSMYACIYIYYLNWILCTLASYKVKLIIIVICHLDSSLYLIPPDGVPKKKWSTYLKKASRVRISHEAH